MKPLKEYPHLTQHDINNLKSALRRAFARSEHHKAVIQRVTVEHSDPRNPRCKNWGYCEICGWVQPRWKIKVDHIDPVIPIDSHFDAMPIEVSLTRMWCDPSNLQAVCDTCHDAKTAREREARKPYAKPRKKKACAKR